MTSSPLGPLQGTPPERFARWIARYPRRVLGGVLLLTALALIPALRFRLETDLTAVFPQHDAPASQDYRELLTTFGGFEKVFVVVEGADAEPLTAAAERLAAELARSPQVAAARSGLTAEEERFFLTHVAPRAPLLLAARGRIAELSRRLEPAAIHTQVATMREALRGPLGSFAAPFFTADPLGLTEDLLGQLQSSLPVDPASGAFLSRDGTAALVVVTPRRSEIDAEGGKRLVADLERACAQVRAESGLPLRFTPLGGPIYAVHDEAIIREDLVRISVGSMLAVGLILLLGFEGLWIPCVLVLSVLAGVVWTAGLVTLGFGRVTVVGLSFVAALFGMGVEYGIHGGARYRALRLRGNDPASALAGTFRETGPAVVSTAMTTAVALGALVIAHFRPLRELGVMLTVGVLAILVTTATLGSSLLVLAPVRSSSGRSLWRRFWEPLFAGITGFASRHPRRVLGAALLVSAVAAWGLPRLALNTDLRSLRPVDHPALLAEQLVVTKFGLGLDTLTALVHGDTLPAALAKAGRVRDVLATALGPGADVSSPSDWLAAEGTAALRPLPLAAAATALERELLAAGFRLEPFAPALAALRTLGRGELPASPPPADWPQGMSELVHLRPGGGAVVAVHARTPLGQWAEGPPPVVLQDLHRIDPKVAVASVPRVGAELRELALSDLRRSSLIAGLLVAVVVVVSLRGRWRDSLLAGVPLTLGCLWTFGLWGLLGKNLDLLCIATLPVLFGTGIDLGVHSLHEAAHDPGGLRGAITQAGLAMTLIALTTGAGFGSLGASRVPGLQNAGWIVSVGVTSCLLATLLVLPALAALRAPREVRPA
jgi:uncharacterized protein